MEKGFKTASIILSFLLPPAGLVFGAMIIHKEHHDLIGWLSIVIGGLLTVGMILTGIMMFY